MNKILIFFINETGGLLMITINVLLKVKAEKEQDYLAFLDDMVQKSRQDDGCLFYDHFRNVASQRIYHCRKLG